MQMRTYIFPSLLCLFLASCGNNHYNPPLSPKVSVSMEEVAYDSYMASPQGNETFQKIHENTFLEVANQPVSTFSVDVDRAAYSNIRRMISNGSLPPKDAVRIEEMINYFDYDYPAPSPETRSPLQVSPELSVAPWDSSHLLLRIGLQAKKIDLSKAPNSNIVFLIDVSGSMYDQNKLPLLKSSLKMLLGKLKAEDKVSIVTYASGTAVALKPTSVREREQIEKVLDGLEASGGTSGSKGIQLAYKQAQEAFIKNGNNRIILATDGDFNIGINNPNDLKEFIEKQRESGIYLTVLGFGMGNYRDDMVETLANSGNGNYAYIDNIMEAKKVLINEFGGTLFTVAKDVKLQVEFNPKYVKSYKLIGYENRMLANEDFIDDKKDAGEIGSGHTITAIYEVIPSQGEIAQSLRYQTQQLNENGKGNEIAFLKIRYKDPKEKGGQSVEVTEPLFYTPKEYTQVTEDFRFAMSVAEFGLLLRESSDKGASSYEQVLELAKNAIGKDEEGYRKEFVRLVESAKLLSEQKMKKE